MRALAKDRSSDTSRPRRWTSTSSDGRGLGVSAETAEAATTVLSRTETRRRAHDAATRASPLPRSTYTPGSLLRVRRAAATTLDLALAARRCCSSPVALVGGFFAWNAIQEQLSANKPVAVPDVEGGAERLAVQQIQDAGLKELVERTDNADVPVGQVFAWDTRSPAIAPSAATSSRSPSRHDRRRWLFPMSSAAAATMPSRS